MKKTTSATQFILDIIEVTLYIDSYYKHLILNRNIN